ncbi:transcription factor HHO2-like [Musa acuminata AAA Group]|uniref:transcription factor HHO2-like n=1 Tax=Musa acuminata AAA Group TaxID=214697 RepID=UPI0031D762A9
MGSAVADVVLDLNLCAVRAVGGSLKEAAALESGDGRVAKLEEYVRSLEEERRKIEAFKRELPLCMILLTDLIEGLKQELKQCRDGRPTHVFEEVIPVKRKREDEGGLKPEADCKDKMSWMSSAQLWSVNSREDKSDSDRNVTEERSGSRDQREEKEKEDNLFLESTSLNGRGAFVPFKGISGPKIKSKEETKTTVMLPDLSLLSPAGNSASSPVSATVEDHPVGGSGSKGVGRAPVSAPTISGAHLSLQVQQQQQQQQLPRKARRCWSSELHRRFVLALEQLGGPQVATPKQIRDLMKVDGLTNDEVKSHLQKYRLHTRKMPNATSSISQPVMVMRGLCVPDENYTTLPRSASHSGSPESPLQLANSNHAISANAGDSCEEVDEKSENYNLR